MNIQLIVLKSNIQVINWVIKLIVLINLYLNYSFFMQPVKLNEI